MPGQQLGCGTNTASIWDRVERRKMVDLDGVTCLEWGRELDDLSEASVTVGRDGLCCAALADVRTWRHALVIHRDGRLVWSGPILTLDYGTEDTVISAVDRFAWLDRRQTVETTTVSGTLVEIAEHIITDSLVREGLTADDVGLVVEYRGCEMGATEREYEACRASGAAELRNLARGPLNFTVVGRRAVVWCGPGGLGRTALLQDKDFRGELRVVEDGYATATAVCVQGEGVIARCGGVDPYYGLLEMSIKDDSVTTAAAAAELACAEVAARSRPPVVLSVPSGVELDPSAPVSIDELVPGVLMPVWSSATCRTVRETMALERVRVRQGCSDGAGEQVSVTVAPAASLGL